MFEVTTTTTTTRFAINHCTLITHNSRTDMHVNAAASKQLTPTLTEPISHLMNLSHEYKQVNIYSEVWITDFSRSTKNKVHQWNSEFQIATHLQFGRRRKKSRKKENQIRKSDEFYIFIEISFKHTKRTLLCMNKALDLVLKRLSSWSLCRFPISK